MSMADHIDPLQIAPDPETLHAFHRQQLSAMLDGELPVDEAKFMLRRLEHDVELAECWERWQVCGEVLRGQVSRVLAEDFAARVAVAIQAPLPRSRASGGLNAHRRPRRRALYWGGAGMAASLALVAAVLVVRLPGDEVLPEPSAVVADSSDVSAIAALPEAQVALAEPAPIHVVPEPSPVVVQAPVREVGVAAMASDRAELAARELLAPTAPVPAVPRPWPRAVGGAGRFAVGYGAAPMPMDPFQPRWTPPPSAFWPEPGVHPVSPEAGREAVSGQD